MGTPRGHCQYILETLSHRNFDFGDFLEKHLDFQDRDLFARETINGIAGVDDGEGKKENPTHRLIREQENFH